MLSRPLNAAMSREDLARTRYPMQHGFTRADAAAGSLGILDRQIDGQSMFLAFMDCFRVFGWITLAMIPLVLAIRKFRPSGSAPAGH
jgi:DHA2 family multidrug resistance protein